ncbi:MAG: hypothetical protein HY238_15920 [Acidobacteria bacterium]|nr:hypothetical protein [Acidobacteriota bacterium]
MWFLYQLATAKNRTRRIGLFAVVAAFAVLVGGLAVLPAWELGSRAYRWVNLPEPIRLHRTVPYTAQQGQDVTPLALLGVITPVDTRTQSAFIGLVSASLALLGVAACWERRAMRLHACVALGGLAYALGSYSVFQGVLYAVVPFLDKAQSPGHAVLLFHFGLAVIAAYGADSLATPAPWLRKGLAVAAAALALIGAGAGSRGQWQVFSAIVAVLLAGILYAAGRNWLPLRGAKAGILLLLLVELSAGTRYLLLRRANPANPNNLDRLAQHREIVQFLRSQPQPFRFHADDKEIPHNLGDWEGLEATGGYLATVSAALFDFVALDWTRTALMLNQVYLVAKQPTRPEQVEVFVAPDGMKVFRNPDAYPRAWLVHNVRGAGDRTAAIRLMQSPEFDPRRETFLVGTKAGAPVLEACEGEGSIEFLARELHRVTVQVRTPCRRMLILSDPLFPGWRAQVDGVPSPLYAAYGALRGVVVGPDEHRVEFAYRPRSVYLGGVLTAMGLAGCLLLAAAAAREARRSRGPGGP